jgi:hypothetical protein
MELQLNIDSPLYNQILSKLKTNGNGSNHMGCLPKLRNTNLGTFPLSSAPHSILPKDIHIHLEEPFLHLKVYLPRIHTYHRHPLH